MPKKPKKEQKSGGESSEPKAKKEKKTKEEKKAEGEATGGAGGAGGGDLDHLTKDDDPLVASAGEGQIVTPWEVEAEDGIDYNKLINMFGCYPITEVRTLPWRSRLSLQRN